MDREGDSPTPAEGHEPATDPVGPSGSRWEPRDAETPTEGPDLAPAGPDDGAASAEPDDQATSAVSAPAGTTGWHEVPTTASPVPRRRRRALRVAAGVGAALLLAGGGFAAGHAVGDDGPDGGAGVGIGHHHGHDDGAGGLGDRDGVGDRDRTGQAPTNRTGQAPAGTTSGGSGAILGGLFT